MVCVSWFIETRGERWEGGLDERRKDTNLGSCKVSMRNDIAKMANEGGVRVGGGEEDIKATFGISKRVGVAVMAG